MKTKDFRYFIVWLQITADMTSSELYTCGWVAGLSRFQFWPCGCCYCPLGDIKKQEEGVFADKAHTYGLQPESVSKHKEAEREVRLNLNSIAHPPDFIQPLSSFAPLTWLVQ